MSDAAEKTAAGATRSMFGAIAFILLMVGGEGMTGAVPIPLFSSIILVAAGALCFYAAVFWENAKKHLAPDTQKAIGQFAKSRLTKFGMLALVLETIILSPFFEGHRWPFSYPADPAVYAENEKLKSTVENQNRVSGPLRESADRWRFVKEMRDANSSRENCHYQLVVTQTARSTFPFWGELLRASGWIDDGQAPTNTALIQPGITLRVSTEASRCASFLQRALTDVYPNPPSKLAMSQSTSCGANCVIVEIDY